jgi:protein SCO1
MRRNIWVSTLTMLTLFTVTALITITAPPAAAENSQNGNNPIPNVPLITQDGKTVHFYDDLIKGKIVALELIYTHCQYSCPLETARMAQVQRMLGDRVGKDIFFYSISIDPARDTPAELKAYAEKYHAGPGWTFLTGKKEDIDFLSKKLGIYSDPSINNDGHSPSLLIGNDKSGTWMRNSGTDNPKFLATMIGEFIGPGKIEKTERKSYAEAKPINLDKGKYIFATRCAACHTVGHGDKIGPDLQGVANVRDRAWLMKFISTPDDVLASKDPIATALFKKYNQVMMPNLRLGDLDLAAVMDFLTAESRGQHNEKPAAARSADAGFEVGTTNQ